MRARASLLIALAATFGLCAGCGDRCPAGNPGSSDVDFSVGDGGTASGVWWLTLSPAVSSSTCADGREVPDQTFAYTLEFKESSDGSGVRTRVLVDGYLFVDDGDYSDASDLLYYETDVREDLDREGGAVTYRIAGNAALTDQGGTLTWVGSEQIKVLSSEDPNVPVGCVFEYDVNGSKVCNE